MRYDNPTIRRHLADAYALGSLQGRARARFERLMADDDALRRDVVAVQDMLSPLALAAPDVQAPSRVRAALAGAIAPLAEQHTEQPREPGWWQRLGFWRGLATATSALAVALVASVGLRVMQPVASDDSQLVYVGVLSDPADKPGVAVLAYKQPFRIEIAAKTPLAAPPGSELRLWMRDRDSGAPGFIAAIPADKSTFPLDDEAWKKLREATALIITQAPPEAPTATPTGTVLYEGVCVNLKKWSDSANDAAR